MTANFQISGKDPHGVIYVVGGETFQQFRDNLTSIFGPDAQAVLSDFAFLLDPSSGQQSAPAAPSSAPAAPAAPGAPSCAHGARTFRSGQGKKGPWSAWFCPLPSDRKSEQCEAIWG